jgi:Cdc6-like AAA superfamily ATPase
MTPSFFFVGTDRQTKELRVMCNLLIFVLLVTVDLQGPPGTGKTQTILGLLSAVLHSAPARMKTK